MQTRLEIKVHLLITVNECYTKLLLYHGQTKQINGHSNCQPCPPGTRHPKYYVRARQLWRKFSRTLNLHQPKIRTAFSPPNSIYLISYSPQTPPPPQPPNFQAGLTFWQNLSPYDTAPVLSTCEYSSNNVLQFLGWTWTVHITMSFSVLYKQQYAVALLAEALRYKSEGRGFDSRWCRWNFSLT